MPDSYSPALPIAYVLLHILKMLNWLMGIAILVMLVAAPTESWIMSELDLKPGPDARAVVAGLHVIAGIGLLTIPLNYLVLSRLLAMVDTVRKGDPFVRANAMRLRLIAWVLLALQIIGLIIAAVAEALPDPTGRIDLDAGPSLTGWLAVLLTFILARVFAEGALMREDLEATI